MTTVQLSLPKLIAPASAAQWLTTLLAIAAKVGIPATDQNTGANVRSLLVTDANLAMRQDIAASLIAQGGLLNYAATGTVVYIDTAGVTQTLYVTPDPSIPAQNPTGALGALDALADSVYEERRILNTKAGGTLALINLSAGSYGPFDSGTYHVSQPGAPGSPTYANAASLTIPVSATAGVAVSAATNATPIAITTSGAHSLATGAIVFIVAVGGNTAANGAYAITVTSSTAFTLTGSVGNGSYTSGGLVYVPTIASFEADVSGSASSAPTLNSVDESVTSLNGVNVGNPFVWLGSDTEGNVALAARCLLKLQSLGLGGPKGAYLYAALTAQILAPTLTPPQTVAANITRALVTLDYTTGTVTITVANGAGAPNTSDLAAVDAVEQAVTGFATKITQAAVEHDVTTLITVYLPASFNTSANVAILTSAVTAYYQALPLAGVSDPGGAANVVPLNGVIGAVEIAGSVKGFQIQDVTATLNGSAANVALALTPIPEVAVPAITVTGVSV